MLRLVERISDYFQDRHSSSHALRLTRQQVTQFLYVHDIRKLERQVSDYLKKKEGLRILFDNLDKGWATNGVSDEDALIVKCLLDATRKLEQTMRPKGIDVHCAVFIRNDVYSLVVSETSDRSKEAVVSLDWNNPDHLREMLLRRLRFNKFGEEITFEEAWRTICVSHMPDGEETAQFLIDRCLMRPRFLINLVNHCKSNAVNSGHKKIEHADIEKGLAAYSTDLIYDIGFEIRDVLPDAEDVLYHFLANPSEVRATDLLVVLELKHGADTARRIVEILIWYGVLGVIRPGGEAAYIHSVNYDVKRLHAMLESQHEPERRFHINPAFGPG
jgi:hypothetical protein